MAPDCSHFKFLRWGWRNRRLYLILKPVVSWWLFITFILLFLIPLKSVVPKNWLNLWLHGCQKSFWMGDFSICSSLKAHSFTAVKAFKVCFFFFFKFLSVPYFIKKVWKFWVFLRKGNPYLRQDCICNIFPYLKISGNRCIWGQADPFKDVCSRCTREGCDQICCENVFVTHW